MAVHEDVLESVFRVQICRKYFLLIAASVSAQFYFTEFSTLKQI
jgi:hypothetical protein